MKANYFVHPSSFVDVPCEIGEGTKIGHFSHIMPHAKIGKACSLGQYVVISNSVIVGNNVNILNNVVLCTGAIIEDDVFLGPCCVFTNIVNPRSEFVRRYATEKTIIRKGATVGANATILCGSTIGQYAFIAAGAVVTRDVPAYALMMGVPARRDGWMSRHGYRLSQPDAEGVMICPFSGLRYRETAVETLRCLDLDEAAPLPQAA